MTSNEAFQYVVVVAKGMGYTDTQIKAFALEIHERLHEMPSTDKDDVDALIEEIF